MPKSIERARELRHEQTSAESVLWQRIRNGHLGYKFRRQVPMGIYTADFACHELRLVIEVDGGQHADSVKDAVRTKFIEGLVFQVVRFWNNDVLDNIEGVVNTLVSAIAARAGSAASIEYPHPPAR